jgi:hypothetical protein
MRLRCCASSPTSRRMLVSWLAVPSASAARYTFSSGPCARRRGERGEAGCERGRAELAGRGGPAGRADHLASWLGSGGSSKQRPGFSSPRPSGAPRQRPAAAPATAAPATAARQQQHPAPQQRPRPAAAHRVRGVHAHDGRGHQRHRARHAVAVLVQLVVRLVPALDQVHAHAVDHVPEGLDVHGELGDGVRQRGVQAVEGAALEDGLQPLLPPVQRLRGRQGGRGRAAAGRLGRRRGGAGTRGVRPAAVLARRLRACALARRGAAAAPRPHAGPLARVRARGHPRGQPFDRRARAPAITLGVMREALGPSTSSSVRRHQT